MNVSDLTFDISNIFFGTKLRIAIVAGQCGDKIGGNWEWSAGNKRGLTDSSYCPATDSSYWLPHIANQTCYNSICSALNVAIVAKNVQMKLINLFCSRMHRSAIWSLFLFWYWAESEDNLRDKILHRGLARCPVSCFRPSWLKLWRGPSELSDICDLIGREASHRLIRIAVQRARNPEIASCYPPPAPW